MSLVQCYRCPACDFQFGPIGIVPVTEQQVQFLVVCGACREPRAISAPPGPLRAVCPCGAIAWESLAACPRCQSPDAGWRSV